MVIVAQPQNEGTLYVKPWFHVKIKHWNTPKFFEIILFHFMMEPRLKFKKIGRSTDGGGLGLKFFKILFNMEPRLNT